MIPRTDNIFFNPSQGTKTLANVENSLITLTGKNCLPNRSGIDRGTLILRSISPSRGFFCSDKLVLVQMGQMGQ